MDMRGFINLRYIPYEQARERFTDGRTTSVHEGIENLTRYDPYLMLLYVFGLYRKTPYPEYAEMWGADTPERAIRMHQTYARRVSRRREPARSVKGKERASGEGGGDDDDDDDDRCRMVLKLTSRDGRMDEYVVYSQRERHVRYDVKLSLNQCSCPHRASIPPSLLCKHVMYVAYSWMTQERALPETLPRVMGYDMAMSRRLGQLCTPLGYPAARILAYRRRSGRVLAGKLGSDFSLYNGRRVREGPFSNELIAMWTLTNFYGIGANQRGVTIANKGPRLFRTLENYAHRCVYMVPLVETGILGWNPRKLRMYTGDRIRLEYRYHTVTLDRQSAYCTCAYSRLKGYLCEHARAVAWLHLYGPSGKRTMRQRWEKVLQNSARFVPSRTISYGPESDRREWMLDSPRNDPDDWSGSKHAVYVGGYDVGIVIPLVKEDDSFMEGSLSFELEVTYEGTGDDDGDEGAPYAEAPDVAGEVASVQISKEDVPFDSDEWV